MAKRSTPQQIQAFIDFLREGKSGCEAAELAQINPPTAKAIHKHLKQVGHCGAFTLTGELPPLQMGTAAKNPHGAVIAAVVKLLAHREEASIMEIYIDLRRDGLPVTRRYLYSVLTKLKTRGVIAVNRGLHRLRAAE